MRSGIGQIQEAIEKCGFLIASNRHERGARAGHGLCMQGGIEETSLDNDNKQPRCGRVALFWSQRNEWESGQNQGKDCTSPHQILLAIHQALKTYWVHLLT